MTAGIVVIVPSRGRPDNALELLRSFDETCRARATRLIFGLDDDDPQLDGYREALQTGPQSGRGTERSNLSHRVRVAIGSRDRGGMVPSLNRLARFHAGPYTPVGFLGDDHRPRTEGWDRQVTEALQDAPIVYGDDLLQGERLPTAVFMDGRIIEALGHMAPPCLRHFYVDDAWLALGQRVGIRYLPDVVIEHVHPAAGKTPRDERYDEVDTYLAADKAAFEGWVRDGLEADVATAEAALGGRVPA